MESDGGDQSKTADDEAETISSDPVVDSENVSNSYSDESCKDLSDLLCKPDLFTAPSSEEPADSRVPAILTDNNDVTEESSKDGVDDMLMFKYDEAICQEKPNKSDGVVNEESDAVEKGPSKVNVATDEDQSSKNGPDSDNDDSAVEIKSCTSQEKFNEKESVQNDERIRPECCRDNEVVDEESDKDGCSTKNNNLFETSCGHDKVIGENTSKNDELDPPKDYEESNETSENATGDSGRSHEAIGDLSPVEHSKSDVPEFIAAKGQNEEIDFDKGEPQGEGEDNTFKDENQKSDLDKNLVEEVAPAEAGCNESVNYHEEKRTVNEDERHAEKSSAHQEDGTDESCINETEKVKGANESATIDDNSQEEGKNLDESLEDPDKDKDDRLANNIEYVCLGDEIDDKDTDADKDSQSNSLENSEMSTQIEENPLQDDSNKDDLLDDDPIGSDGFIVDNQEGADEELCIIPDTERVISQAEKEAAFSIPPLRDISESGVSNEGPEGGNCNSTIGTSTTPPTNKFIVSKCNIEDLQNCLQCALNRKAKYSACKDGDGQYICSDDCFESFKSANADGYVLNWEGEIRVKNLTNTEKELQPQVCFERKCVVCNKIADDEENNLTWEIMDFCNEYCLSKYQKEIGSVCSSCGTEVRPNSLGKYCVRFGNDIRQFCSSHCLEEYKKGLKVCSYCQRDMSGGSDGFLAPVGDKGQFKDFCSQLCMEKYDIMTNNRPPKVDEGTKCSVCKTDNTITIEFDHDSSPHHFCSDRCFVAFSFVNNIAPSKCSMCRRYFPTEILEKNTMFYDNVQYSFCSNSCQNIYIIAHRKIVPCIWCKVKKYNFDMIRRYFKTGPVLNMCSINCLSLFQVSVNAVNSKKTVCNFCNKRHQPMYHLTMSDATIRNFCSYTCVMSFQNKFKKSPITLNSDDQPVPTGEPKKNRKYSLNEPTSAKAAATVSPTLPVISSVQSLASKNGTYVAPTAPSGNTIRPTRTKTTTGAQSPSETQIKIKHHIIIKPPPIPDQRNVATMCKVRSCNKSTLITPLSQDKGIQTDEREAERILIPVPVPIYIPSPLPMYSVPVPYPLPFPIPIPVPIFIPTTRNSAKGIMKEIKKIQVKIPTDPYEAELLMMAEMVAGDKKEENTESESEVDDNPAADDGGTFSPEPADASNTFGDDMLQMALKMATELEEPAVDLEGALTANTITAPQGSEAPADVPVDDSQPILQMPDRPASRGRKRGSRGRGGGTKRRRTSHQPVEMPVMPPQAQAPPEPAEKPDAHLCLKYTFGVNAWKQWVATKNAELEKSTKYVKPLKTEILQLTSDELNYSLCLFVKEVRKPNGAEYAPDTIYYLCLGIQQYLFENNRIDNIFCDPYYEQFTESLDEIARKFSILYNDSHYIVTRVEEEHLWESKQLGAHSPHVLLSTLMFFNTKHFNLTTVEEHKQLSFSHIMKHWKRNPNQPGVARTPGSRNVLLRFYPPQSAVQNNARKKKVYEQQENDENPLRCPVKLYEFYLSKCPESVKTRNDVFYLQPERSCVPDSPVWYSTTALNKEALEKMLHRVKMVKEINVALLTS